MRRILFLPGASGTSRFWRAAAAALPSCWETSFLAWPGLGREPHEPGVEGIDGLVAMVLERLTEPVDLVAHSMGGIVAIKTVLRAPESVRRLVLTGTSGGLPIRALGGADWRPEYRNEYPEAATWITEVEDDLSEQLPLVSQSTLLIWGDRDEISPLAVAERLLDVLPDARLEVVVGGQHNFPQTHADKVGRLLQEHLV